MSECTKEALEPVLDRLNRATYRHQLATERHLLASAEFRAAQKELCEAQAAFGRLTAQERSAAGYAS